MTDVEVELASVYKLAITEHESAAKRDEAEKAQEEQAYLASDVPHPSKSPQVMSAQNAAWRQYYATHTLHGINLRKKIYHRYWLGWSIFIVLVSWLGFVATLLVLVGLKVMILSDAILGGLLTSGVLNVFGFGRVVKYLFNEDQAVSPPSPPTSISPP
jgi:hypothetical protein